MSDLWLRLRPQLESLYYAVPPEVLAEVEQHREELAPLFIEELERVAANPSLVADDDDALHIYAMVFLARWRDVRAYRPLLAFTHLDEAALDAVLGQLLHDIYGRALASCCDGDAAPLFALIEDASRPMPLRMVALESLTLAVLASRTERTTAIAFMTEFAIREAERLKSQGATTDDDCFELLDLLVSCLGEVAAQDSLPLIREWFAAGLADPTFIPLEQVERYMERGAAENFVQMSQNNLGLIDDVHLESQRWLQWQAPFFQPPAIPLGLVREPIRREEAKVGRNDPCPCGSGRKYKKCHGA